MRIDVGFPGGKKVDAKFGDFVVKTDQPVKAGGEASAPAPFDLFQASLATCAGIYALGFCQARDIPTDGLALVQQSERDEAGRLRVSIELHLPTSFPEKYRDAIRRAVELCAVKKAIQEQPEFSVTVG